MSTAVFYDLENISKFTTPKNYGEFRDSFKMMCDSELVDNVVLQRAYISTTHPAYIKYNKYLNSTGIEICAVDPNMNSKKANLVDFKMNVDCIAYSLSNDIDTVVIATGDADFGFLCEELKNYGKKVVVASYGITTNKSIIILCDDWVDFSHEYTLCDINELMASRIHPEDPIDYRAAVRGVLTAMLEDKLVKRYMALERFDLDMLRSFTEKFYKAPRLEDMSYIDFVSMLISGIDVAFRNKNGRMLIVPSDECVPEPPLSIYEIISGMDYEFSTERFRAWHSWFEDNIDSVQELVYYMNFMTRNKLLNLDDDGASIVPQRKCAASLIEHTSMALSLLNIKPEDKELEKLRNRFYRNPSKHRLQKTQQESSVEEITEPEIYIQGTMTNFGRIVVYADDEAVFKVEFTDEFVKYNANEITSLAAKELREYFKGERREFTVPVKLDGSEFQKSVWEELRKIPYGETRTYKDIANMIGKPKSARAVGRACNANTLLFIVPCHRVIAASGDLTGFAAGLELKEALLKSESSPEDFKRFGKQYSFNIRHPESRCNYRSSEEIRRVLDEENPSAEDIIDDSAPIEQTPDTNTEPETENSEEAEVQSEPITEPDNTESPKAAIETNEPTEPEVSAESVKPTAASDEMADTETVEPNPVPEVNAPADTEATGLCTENQNEETCTEALADKDADTEAVSGSEATDSEQLNETEPLPDTDSAVTAESTEEIPSPQARKRRAPYRRRTKKPSDGKTTRRYSAKKHTIKPKEDNE